jgi:flavorubredoxin
MITNRHSGTMIDEIAAGVYRISTPVDIPAIPGGFSFNQFLIVDEEPVLFHTGLRRLFPLTREAVDAVLPVARLRHVGFSHFEADESGALNEFLAVSPQAAPFSSDIAAMVSVNDVADRTGRGLADGERLSTGSHQFEWISTPHVPHGWDCGVLFDHATGALFCGDLFTQAGRSLPPVTEREILTASETMRKPMDYFAHSRGTGAILERLAALRPKVLACMHGSAYRGDAPALLRGLAAALVGHG